MAFNRSVHLSMALPGTAVNNLISDRLPSDGIFCPALPAGF
jgi:hypothetical protein